MCFPISTSHSTCRGIPAGAAADGDWGAAGALTDADGDMDMCWALRSMDAIRGEALRSTAVGDLGAALRLTCGLRPRCGCGDAAGVPAGVCPGVPTGDPNGDAGPSTRFRTGGEKWLGRPGACADEARSTTTSLRRGPLSSGWPKRMWQSGELAVRTVALALDASLSADVCIAAGTSK